MTYEALQRISLQPGQAWRAAVDARTSVQVLRGRVALRALSARAGGDLHAAGMALDELCEGQAHRLDRAGWIEVAAHEEAELLSYRQPGPIAEAWRELKTRFGTFPDASPACVPTAAVRGGMHPGPWSWISSKARLSCWPFAGSRP